MFLRIIGALVLFSYVFITVFITFAQTSTSVINKNETEYDAEFLQALQFAYEKGITKFKTIEDFKPYDKVTREQSAKMIGQFALNIFNKTLDETKTCKFIDIANADYSLADHIIQACKIGIMKGGSDGYFLPGFNLSKAQGIAVLIRLFNNGLMDESISPRYKNYFEKAKELGLTTESNIDALERPLTRYELVLLLYRFYVKYDLLNKFGNTFDMGGSAIKMIEETTNPDGLKHGKAIVDTKKFLDQNITSVNMNIFGMDYRIDKIKLVNQFTDAFTWYGDVYKEDSYVGAASFNIVKEILTDGTIRPLDSNNGKYYTIAMSSQPPFYDIKEVIQSTLGEITTGNTLTNSGNNGIFTDNNNTTLTGSSTLSGSTNTGNTIS